MAIWKKCKKISCVILCSSIIGLSNLYASQHLSITPLYTIPFFDSTHKNGLGVALNYEIRPFSSLGFFVEGQYLNLQKVAEGLKGTNLFDGNLGVGLRLRFADRLSFNADILGGVYSSKYSVNQSSYTVSGIDVKARVALEIHLTPGISISPSASYSHYIHTSQNVLSGMNVGATISFDLDELFNKKTNLRAEVETLDPVFPVLYSWYNDNSFGKVKLFNEEESTITDVKVSFFQEQYMAQPKLCNVIDEIKKDESAEVDLTAFFNENCLELTEKTDTSSYVLVDYKKLGQNATARLPITIPVYNRNAMSWKDDRRAAAFVSSKDPAALWFAKYISSVVNSSIRGGINKNVQYAMGLLEALNEFGINYVIDPTSAYSDNINGESIDFLQFPYQTLMYRGGDCDDLSILYCSLLEAIGIDTAFITVPGHIFTAFSTGLTEEEARKSFSEIDQIIFKDGMAWIPIEITISKEGFDKTWRIAARQWNKAAETNSAILYPMKDSWKIYPPISVPGAVTKFNMPQENSVALRFNNSMNVFVERESRPTINRLRGILAQSEDPETRNLLGVVYGRYGMNLYARQQFLKASEFEYLPSWLNLANVYFNDKDYQNALTWYNRVLEQEPDNTYAILGCARCYYEMNDYVRSDTLYNNVIESDIYLAQEYAYLGSFTETQGRSWSFADRLGNTKWVVTGNYVAKNRNEVYPLSYSAVDNLAEINNTPVLLEVAQESAKEAVVSKVPGQTTRALLLESQNEYFPIEDTVTSDTITRIEERKKSEQITDTQINQEEILTQDFQVNLSTATEQKEINQNQIDVTESFQTDEGFVQDPETQIENLSRPQEKSVQIKEKVVKQQPKPIIKKSSLSSELALFSDISVQEKEKDAVVKDEKISSNVEVNLQKTTTEIPMSEPEEFPTMPLTEEVLPDSKEVSAQEEPVKMVLPKAEVKKEKLPTLPLAEEALPDSKEVSAQEEPVKMVLPKAEVKKEKLPALPLAEEALPDSKEVSAQEEPVKMVLPKAEVKKDELPALPLIEESLPDSKDVIGTLTDKEIDTKQDKNIQKNVLNDNQFNETLVKSDIMTENSVNEISSISEKTNEKIDENKIGPLSKFFISLGSVFAIGIGIFLVKKDKKKKKGVEAKHEKR